jgi:hypothetical protein
MKTPLRSDHPGYSCEKTHWVFVTGVEPLNHFPTDYLSGFRRNALKTTFNNRTPKHHVHHVACDINIKCEEIATICEQSLKMIIPTK